MIILLHPVPPLCRKNWNPAETCPSQCDCLGFTLVGTADARFQFGPFSSKSWFKGSRVGMWTLFIGFCDSWWLLGSTGNQLVPMAWHFMECYHGHKITGRGNGFGGNATAKTTPSPADFLQLQYKTSENHGTVSPASNKKHSVEVSPQG